ncbi:hypothetical protein PV392_02085 [Streptomyces sp. ME03-5709C]|nr:hypothetical protein [Streptomyces sp. ME03-5709C]
MEAVRHERVTEVLAERHGGIVRLTVDTERDASPAFEVDTDVPRGGIEGAERDPAGFLRAAADRAAAHLRDHAFPVVAAPARGIGMPPPRA